ncbi:hypothetical protein [Chitinophaga sp. MM2321]|uniref:hypothetical protein n=1 Tax=Chitinophaga sp. MM2321 TaxID=3137178 RepID=UPI0032D5A5B4
MKGFVLLLILMATIDVKAQTVTYSTIDFPNVYANKITTCLFSANFRSGFIHQTNGSINMGLTGVKNHNFKFRWLAHDAGAIDYSSDIDQVMYLDGWGI